MQPTTSKQMPPKPSSGEPAKKKNKKCYTPCQCGNKQRNDKSTDHGASGKCNKCLRAARPDKPIRDDHGNIKLVCNICNHTYRPGPKSLTRPGFHTEKCEKIRIKRDQEQAMLDLR